MPDDPSPAPNRRDDPARPLLSLAVAIPTGAKVFLILSVALLPLALIAAYASIQTSRIADQEAAARLRVAAAEASRALSIELGGDLAALRAGLNALEADPTDTGACARVQGVYAAQATTGVQFHITGKAGAVLCGGQIPEDAARALQSSARGTVIVPARGLAVRLTAPGDEGVRAEAFFPIAFLGSIARPTGFLSRYGAALASEDGRLSLEALPDGGILDGVEETRLPLGIEDLALEMRIYGAPITTTLIVTMLLPLLMWFAAAAIAWFVVDRLLIRPLRRLRRIVGNYRPGDTLAVEHFGTLPAQEIHALSETFRAITVTVRTHEAGLAEGLVRQTRLTREVHHRVKNNLQVIASLINFHARSTSDTAASEAYAAIQRRVDALAVVHRHHYAELEENRGLELRAVIGELASNLRANAPDSAARTSMTLNVHPVLVSQDVAVAVAFLITELVELAMECSPAGMLSISVRPTDGNERAVVRITSPGLVDSPDFQTLMQTRYSRIITGLARQLRSTLHHDPLAGFFEIPIVAHAEG
ncbi:MULTISPECIES: sensor histidine kinase [unclassified Sphingomonas]|uniref:sensor histidine kinase n=1 Tax=unclassified Sphingomonas TaxID=196159 RepID=UPI000B0FD79B|nr:MULTISPECIES: sensor histidine kinase [unclassified Sphingomonas]